VHAASLNAACTYSKSSNYKLSGQYYSAVTRAFLVIAALGQTLAQAPHSTQVS
jgi:hypothetical protein